MRPEKKGLLVQIKYEKGCFSFSILLSQLSLAQDVR
jgi:hypothetical protein